MSQPREYVLGTDDAEIERLGLQHRVWRPFVLEAWSRAGIGPGDTVVDLGCGPGFATIDLSSIVGPEGRVIAVDQSRRFLEHLEGRAHQDGHANIEIVEANLNRADSTLPFLTRRRGLPPFTVWCRWILAFVHEPRAMLAWLANTMRPGDAIVLHEYYDYATWRLLPAQAELAEFVAEVMAAWRADGGEPDIGLHLPQWLAELGVDARSTRSLVHIAAPSDPIWDWPAAFVRGGTARLATLGRLTEQRAAEIRTAFDLASRQPGVRMITPAVMEVIASKPA